jgi:hypothetical protein
MAPRGCSSGQGRRLPPISPQVLRHSFASLVVDLGYSKPTIAVLIGYTGRGVTSRHAHRIDMVPLVVASRGAEVDGLVAIRLNIMPACALRLSPLDRGRSLEACMYGVGLESTPADPALRCQDRELGRRGWAGNKE